MEGGYRLVGNENLGFDLLLGLKFIYFNARLESNIAGTLPITAKLERLWVDPAIAANFIFRSHKRIELMAYGDIGASLLNTDLTYQAAVNANILIYRHILVSADNRNYFAERPKK